ncbi:MAG: GNAT family N-acetyltransferase [Alphaproteobacteria bacterium]|nr:GNAT family N-acetyltransferase [Alphaproteobacteria bacterium]
MTAEHIRQATASDLDGLGRIAAEMGTVHEPGYFERCLAEQREKKRVVLIAAQAVRPVGYVQLIWQPLYQPFRKQDIPEIQDLNVIPEARQQGLGGRLVEACEALVRQAGKSAAGIGVGLYSRYGAAQRLYVKKGYIPDGAGVCYDDAAVRANEMRAIDDLLTLKLIKDLK